MDALPRRPLGAQDDGIIDRKTVKLLKTRGFDRFLARRQAYFDARLTAFGALIYAVTAVAVAQGEGHPPGAAAVPLAYGAACLGVPLLAAFVPEAYYRWRNLIFVGHFYLHHCSAPAALVRIGVKDMPRRLPPHLLAGSRLTFFLAVTFFRTLLWQILNVLMYRVRVGVYWAAQPLILAAAAPLELEVCAWAVERHPAQTAAVYGDLITWGRLVGALFHPVLPPLLGPDLDPLAACRRIHAFLLFFLGYLVPGFIIWRLERHVWHEYLAADVAVLAWPGGPPPGALAAAQRALRREEAARRRSPVEAGGGQLAAAAAVAAVVWWSASDLFL